MNECRTAMNKGKHFFKVILHQNTNVKIPTKFAMGIGEEMPKVAVLNVADGREWRVELKKYGENDFWLENGWEEFARHYSLSYGHFLVFRYHGNEAFHVLIFDVTATEIQYPSSPPTILEQNHHQHQHQHQHQSSVDHQFMKPIKRTVSPLMSSPRPSKMMRTAISTSKTHLGISGGDHKRGLNSDDDDDDDDQKNPSFSVYMRPTYVAPLFILNVPYKFCKNHFKQERGEVVLMMNKRSWLVHYRLENCNGKPKAIFHRSWREFVEDNNLRAGDICDFELIRSSKHCLNVTIFSGFDQEKKKMISAGRDFSSTETPFFEVVIQYKGSVVIPKEFVRKHMKGDERSVRVRMGEGESKWWVVKLLHYPSAYILSAGWTAFAKYNSLQQGDICKFQLINKPQSLFKISIVSPPSSSFYL